MLHITSKEFGIYRIVCKKNGFAYIGSTSGDRGFYGRVKTHRILLKQGKHHSWLLQRDFNKFGEEAFVVEILEICSREKCMEIEQKWLDITGVGSKNKSYNINPMASSQLGAKRSEESRERMRIAQRGKKMPSFGPRSEEVKEKLRIANTGKRLSPETRAKISEAGKRRVATPESTAAMRQWNRENPLSPEARRKLLEKASEASSLEYIITPPGGESEFQIKNLAAFCRKQNLSLSSMRQVASRRMISHRGWKCRYITESREEQEARIQLMSSAINKKKYLICSPKQETFETENLQAFCRQHNLCESGMRAVARGRNLHCKGWTCFYANESEEIRQKRLSLKGKAGLKYIVTTPENVEIYTRGLVKLCKTYNLCHSAMTKVARGKLDQHKGFKVRYAEPSSTPTTPPAPTESYGRSPMTEPAQRSPLEESAQRSPVYVQLTLEFS